MSGTRFLLLFLVLLGLSAAPLALVEIPPLIDYPNHLARMHILANEAGSEPLRRFYAIEWRPLPNLAMDLIVPLLSRLMPLTVAGKVFLIMVFALQAGGAALVHRAIWGRWSPWPCLAFFFLYNRILIWGFVNFLFGIGIGLCGFAAWIALRDRPAPLRIAVSMVFALAAYLSHLFAFGAYGLMIAGYEAGLLYRSGRLLSRATLLSLATAGVQAVPPAILFLAAPAGEGGGRIVFSPFLRKFDILFNVVDDYVRWFDIATFALLVGLLLHGWARRRITVKPAMIWPLAALLAAHFALPNTILTAIGVDHRMPLVLALLLAASVGTQATLPRRNLVLGGLFLLFVARLGIVGMHWRSFEETDRPALAALRSLPPGSRVAIAYPAEAVNVPRRGPPLLHFPALAALNDAFVPTLFAFTGQQPLAFTPEYRRLAAATNPEALWRSYAGEPAAEAEAVLAQYDYLVLSSPEPFAPRRIEGLEPVLLLPQFKLYKIAHS